MGASINTTYITIDGDVGNDVLRTSNLLNDGTFQGHEFTLNGLDGDDTLIALNGSRNWPVFTVANPTELLVVTTYLNGGAGNDRLFSTVGFRDLGPALSSNYGHSTYMYGGDGDDLYVLRGAYNSIREYANVGSGNDTVLLTTAFATATGGGFFDLSNFDNVENIRVQAGVGNTQLLGNGSNNNIVDNAGNGSISGDLGNDTISGQAGNDTVFGEDGNDDLRGGAGSDEMYGGAGDNLLYGGSENDTLTTDTGNDKLYGGTGDDYLSGGLGQDTLNGGDGIDSLYGGFDDDNLTGGAGNDTIYGNDGNDLMYGGDGDDFVAGGVGNDVVMGGLGNDTLAGGGGDDYFGVNSLLDAVYEFASEGNDTVASGHISLDGINFQNIETLQLTGTADLNITGSTATTLIGNDGHNDIRADAAGSVVTANAGNDYIEGSSNGNDSAYGGSGDDQLQFFFGSGSKTLDGGAGNDSLNGSSGDDYLIGGLGSDYLNGGPNGADTFVFSTADYPAIGDSLEPVVAPIDTIGDFTQGVDKIDISGFGPMFGNLASSMNIMQGIHGVSFDLTGGGTIRAESISSSRLVIDVDGDGGADGYIDLVGQTASNLQLSDFLFIQMTP